MRTPRFRVLAASTLALCLLAAVANASRSLAGGHAGYAAQQRRQVHGTATSAAGQPASPGAPCWREWGGATRTVLFVADPGEMSSTPEARLYLKNLRNTTSLPARAAACAGVTFGSLLNRPVAVITTGIGSETAAMVGDICVSPFAVNFNCRMASWSDVSRGYPNVCTFPGQQYGPKDNALFGRCIYAGAAAKAGLGLASEVERAAVKGLGAVVPARPGAIQQVEEKYWAAMAGGMQTKVPNLLPNATPRVWNYTECMEVSTSFFWSGAPWDMVARKYVSDALSTAGIPNPKGQEGVVTVSAMEGIGVAAAFERYAESPGGRAIPYTIVRGASDTVMQPVALLGTAAGSVNTNSGSASQQNSGSAGAGAATGATTGFLSSLWARLGFGGTRSGGGGGSATEQGTGSSDRTAGSGSGGSSGAVWVDGQDVKQDMADGYHFAIETASAAVLLTLQARCVARVGGAASSTATAPGGPCHLEFTA